MNTECPVLNTGVKLSKRVSHLKKFASSLLVLFFVVGCYPPRYDIYYNPIKECAPLPDGKRARVIQSLDPTGALQRFKKEGFIQIGSVQFEDERISHHELADYAATKGATLVIVCSRQCGTYEKTYVQPVYSYANTYSSGNIGSINVSGSSSTIYTSYQERSYTVGKYEHTIFFLKNNQQ